MTVAHSDFDIDTAVEAVGDNHFRAVLSDRWNARHGVVNGGYMLAVCLRAIARTLPFADPLTVSAHYLRPGSPGEAAAETEAVRLGRRIATGQARLCQGDVEIVRATASFADLDAEGETARFDEPPALPPPEECVPLEAPPPGATIAERVDYRYPTPPGWQSGHPRGQPHAAFWMRLADGRAPDPLSLALLTDAAAPAVLEIGARGSSTIELTAHLRARPEPGWLACRASTRHVINGYHEEDFEIWDSGGRLVAQARQLARLS